MAFIADVCNSDDASYQRARVGDDDVDSAVDSDMAAMMGFSGFKK